MPPVALGIETFATVTPWLPTTGRLPASSSVTFRTVTLDDVGSLPVVESQGVTVANVSIPTATGGIQLLNTQNSVVRDSRVDNGGRYGVAIRRCETCLSEAPSGNNEVRNVQVQNAGIVVIDSTDDVVTDSEVTDSFFGVLLKRSEGTMIRRNDLSDGSYGVAVENDDPTAATTTVARLERNTITDNGRGVYLDAEAGRVAVVENTIVRNNAGVYVWPVSSSETDPEYDLHRNHLDNDRYGVLNRDRSLVVNATGNYWGAADGPSSRTEALEDPETGALADGSGDAISRGDEEGVSNVRFDPFLKAPPSAAPAPPAENDSAA